MYNLVIVSHLTRTFSFHTTTFFHHQKSYDQRRNSLFQDFWDRRSRRRSVDVFALLFRSCRRPTTSSAVHTLSRRPLSQTFLGTLDDRDLCWPHPSTSISLSVHFLPTPKVQRPLQLGLIVAKTALSLELTSSNSQTITFVTSTRICTGSRVLWHSSAVFSPASSLSFFSASVSGGSRSLIMSWRSFTSVSCYCRSNAALKNGLSGISKSSIFAKRDFANRYPFRELDSTSRFVFFTLQSTSSSLSVTSRLFAPDSGDCDSFHGPDTLFVEAQLWRAVSSNVICFVDDPIRTTSVRLTICFRWDLKSSRFPSNFDSLLDPAVYLLVILSLHSPSFERDSDIVFTTLQLYLRVSGSCASRLLKSFVTTQLFVLMRETAIADTTPWSTSSKLTYDPRTRNLARFSLSWTQTESTNQPVPIVLSTFEFSTGKTRSPKPMTLRSSPVSSQSQEVLTPRRHPRSFVTTSPSNGTCTTPSTDVAKRTSGLFQWYSTVTLVADVTPTATWFHGFPTDSTPLPTLLSERQSRFGSVYLFVTSTWLRVRHSETRPSCCLKGHSFNSFRVRPVVCPGRPVSPDPLRLTRSGPAIVVLSINRCHPVTQCSKAPSSFISFVYAFLSFACRVFPQLFSSGLGLSIFFFPQDPLESCRLFVAMDTPSASTRSSDIFLVENADDSNVWNVFLILTYLSLCWRRRLDAGLQNRERLRRGVPARNSSTLSTVEDLFLRVEG